MSTYDRVKDLSLTINSHELVPLIYKVAGDLGDRQVTIVTLHGKGMSGVGEDVTYIDALQTSFQTVGLSLPLAGNYTLDEFSKHLDTLDCFPDAPDNVFGRAFLNYRRWAIESAALDLALQQNDTTLAEVLGMEVKPLTFVASMRLGDPSSYEPIKRRLERYPNMRFKLDPTNDWTDELIAQIARCGAVDTVDFKGFYKGLPIEVKPDPELYKKVVEAFPEAWLEDPDVTEQTKPILEPHSDRVTWDFPIHGVASINSQVFVPKMVNIKPSRFGPVRELFDTYDYCNQQGIGMYSGGQTEIGPGRGQVQYLSALFHPDAPNDIAPAVYNSADSSVELPTSPLILNTKPTGFGINES